MDLTTVLQLRANNPYSIGSLFDFGNGEILLDGADLVYVPSPKDRTFMVTEADDIWSIAFDAYVDSKLYWVIQKVNDIQLAADLPVGEEIIIPDLDFLFANQPD